MDSRTESRAGQKKNKKSKKARKERNSLTNVQSKKFNLQKDSSYGSLNLVQDRSSFGALNQQSLDQLGPMVKMTLNGYPLSSMQSTTAKDL